jgi:membrane associated rhomboid family serine protease
MFMHGGTTHILFNMFGLWMFGSAVEHALGKNKFLFLYFSAGLGAVLFQLLSYYINYIPTFSDLEASGISSDAIINIMNTGSWNFSVSDIQEEQLNKLYSIYNSTMVGASGCLFGVIVAFGVLNPNAELMLIFLPIPIKAKYFISLYVAYDIISGFFGSTSLFGSNIAHWAHVGGAAIGFIIMWYWKKNQFNQNRWDR